MRRAVRCLGWLSLSGWLAACTETNIYISSMEPNIPNKITISGTVCSDDPSERQFPVRVMFIVDTSGSMSQNDPDTHRMTAVQDVVNRYMAADNYTFAVIKYAGVAKQLTAGYTKRMDQLNEAIASLATIDPCANGWCRNWLGALSLASSVFTGDVLTTNPGALSRTRYVFIFVSNGPPQPGLADQAEEKRQLVEAVREMAEFGVDNGVAEVAFHAVQLDDVPGTCQGLPNGEIRYCNSSTPCPPNCQGGEVCQQPQRLCSEDHGVTCNTDDDCSGSCEFIRICSNDPGIICVNNQGCCPTYPCNDPQAALNDKAAGYLQAMAFAGRGEHLRFTIGARMNFLTLDFHTTQGVFVKKAFLVTNANAKTLCGEILPDSDGDGLADREEMCYGEILSGACRELSDCRCEPDVWSKLTLRGTDTDPRQVDTDGDGLGDLVEMLFATVNLDPLRVDLPQACFGLERPYKDRDIDGLNDCEEKLLGTDPSLFDSDRDGYPDRDELKAGSNYLQPDNLRDIDMDGIPNGVELQEHLDPQCNDTLARSAEAYRYKLIDEGLRTVPYSSQPQRLSGVEVTNVSGRAGAGASSLYFYPAGTQRDDGTVRQRPTLAWKDAAHGSPGLEAEITGSGDYVLFSACSCVHDCPGGCPAGQWCNPATGSCDPDPCTRAVCASTETCDPFQGRCVADCTKAECGLGERCDPLLGKCLTDLCLNMRCPDGMSCDTEAGKCTGAPCQGWTCPAGLRLRQDAKPPWITVQVDETQLPQSGFWCDGSQSAPDCTTDADCPAGSRCRIRETLVVGLADKNCLSFKVKNITLVETLEVQAGFGPGYNNLFVYFAQTPLDNPHAYAIFRVAPYQIRFVDGRKDPNVAEMPLDDSDFYPIQER